jgi:hypothetical protein
MNDREKKTMQDAQEENGEEKEKKTKSKYNRVQTCILLLSLTL